jgi:hypothetical protein
VEKGGCGMKLYLNFDQYAKTGGGTWEDFSSALLDNFNRKSCFGRDGKAEMQTVTMELKNESNIVRRITSSANNIRAKVLENNNTTPYFIGTIRPLVSADVRDQTYPVSVDILDDSLYLEQYIFDKASAVSTSLKVVSSTVADSMIHWLVAKCVVKDSGGSYVRSIADADIVIDAGVDTAVLAEGISVSTGDMVNTLLDTICYEYNLQYRFDASGKMHIAKSLPASSADLSGARTIADANIINYLRPQRADDSNQGAVVKYYPVSKSSCRVAEHDVLDTNFADDKTFSRGYEWLNTDEPGGQYPPAAYDDVTLSEYDLDKPGRKILRHDLTTLKARVEFHDGSRSVSHDIASIADNSDGTYSLKIVPTVNKTLVKKLFAICDCWYIDKDLEQTTQVHPGQNPQAYDSKFLHSGITATALLKAIVLRNLSGKLSYSFQALPALALVPGEIVYLASVAWGVSGYVRITSVVDHADSKTKPLVDVIAESVTPLSDLSITPTEIVKSAYIPPAPRLSIRPDTVSAIYSAPGVVVVTASGSAITELGGTLAWYLNDVDLSLSGSQISIDHADLITGVNTIRAVASITGIDFGDKPLDAECTVTLSPVPLDRSDEVGVDYQNPSGNVKILSSGKLKAVDGEFSGKVNANDGVFSGDILGELFKAKRGVTGDSVTMPTAERFTGVDAYDALTFIPAVGNSSKSYATATSVTGTIGGKAVDKMQRLYNSLYPSVTSAHNVYIWFSDATELELKGNLFYSYAISLTAPSTWNNTSLIIYRSVEDLVTMTCAFAYGVRVLASGTVYNNGTEEIVTGFIPYSDHEALIEFYSGDSLNINWYVSYDNEGAVNGWKDFSGTITVVTEADVVETSTMTPMTSSDSIGTTEKPFLEGVFSSACKVGTAVKGTDAGSVILTNGLIIKWGMLNLGQDDDETKTFPVPFPNYCTAVILQGTADSAAYTNGIYLVSWTDANFRVKTRSTAQVVPWIAIGY